MKQVHVRAKTSRTVAPLWKVTWVDVIIWVELYFVATNLRGEISGSAEFSALFATALVTQRFACRSKKEQQQPEKRCNRRNMTWQRGAADSGDALL